MTGHRHVGCGAQLCYRMRAPIKEAAKCRRLPTAKAPMATRAVNKSAKEGEQNARLLFVSGRVIGHGDISPRCIPECSAMALHRAVPAARPSRASTLSFVLLTGRRSPSPAFGAVFCGESGSYLVRGESKRSSMARSSRMRSRATGSGNIPPRCVPRRSTMAKCSRDAFPSVRRWRDCALMRPWPDWQWQYSCAVRSRAAIRGNFSLHASRKWPRTGKSPVRGKIRAPCIRNELALARYARHASEKPCKQLFGNTPREDLARKGRLSLHGPLESCTARRSCHPSWRQTARAPATPVPPNSVSRQS